MITNSDTDIDNVDVPAYTDTDNMDGPEYTYTDNIDGTTYTYTDTGNIDGPNNQIQIVASLHHP